MLFTRLLIEDFDSLFSTKLSQQSRLISEEYIRFHSKLKMKCDKGHIFEIRFDSFRCGHRCRICADESRKHTYEFVKFFIENEGTKLLSKEYINVYSKLKVECPEGHQYPVTFNSFQNGSRCPYCNDYRNENECREIFEKLTGFRFIKIRPKWLKNPKTNRSLELDGYCEELKMAFEHDGKQHFEESEFFHRKKNCSLEEIQFRDHLKDKLCIENGVKLLRIKYDIEDKEKLINELRGIFNSDLGKELLEDNKQRSIERYKMRHQK